METPSPCPGRVNQCTPSCSRARHQSPRPPPRPPPSSTYTTIYTATNVAVANPPTLSPASTTLSLSIFLSRNSDGPIFFAPEKGELGGVGDVRLLHYVFLTEPPLTSTLSLVPLIPRPSGAPSFPFHPAPLPPPFLRTFSTLPFRVSPPTENESFPLLKSFFFLARADVPFNHPTRRR